MATRPTVGGSDGTWGTELNEHLDVSLDADGKVDDGAAQTTSAAPGADAELVNKKYADTGDTVQHDAEGGYDNVDVDGTKTKVYTKYLTGTLSGVAPIDIVHSIAGIDNILFVGVSIFDDGSTKYRAGDNQAANVATQSFTIAYDGTNIRISNIGADILDNKYRIKISYIL